MVRKKTLYGLTTNSSVSRDVLWSFIKEVQDSGIDVKLVKSKAIKLQDGTKTAGYFDSTAKEMSVAVFNESWVDVLVHEYCHFKQWREDIPMWNDSYVGDQDMLCMAMQHINGEIKLSKRKLAEYLHKSALIERDCEIRTVKKLVEINHLETPEDIADYCKAANAYITFYYAVNTLLQWYDIAPYCCEEILEVMPSTIEEADHKALAEMYIDLFRNCL